MSDEEKQIREKKLAWERDNRRFNMIRIWQKRYAHMVARHDGRSTNHSNSNGKGICTREEFFEWCKHFDNLNVFLALYFDWAGEGFPLHLSPSVDRINPDLGYVVENLQWLSFEENCRKNNINPINHSSEVWE